ncbi:hypothetical protein J3459_014063 [Metarhizium acridum]|nr:hypothetical protein J3459_014063 [Metarhizium acridum]
MKLMYWGLALGPTLLQMGAAALDSSENSATKPSGHIVVLKRELTNDHIDRHIDWVNQMHKGNLDGRDDADQSQGIKHTYRSDAIGFHGYSGRFSDEVLQQIKQHEHVDFVEEDRIITLEPGKRDQGQGENPPVDAGNRNKKNGVGILRQGQGYNSFLEKGRIFDAVVWRDNAKRDQEDGSAANETFQAEKMFEFTPPTTGPGDFANIDMKKYFTVPETSEIEERVASEIKELKEEMKKQAEEKVKMIETNEIQTRAENARCPGTLRKEYKLTEDYNSYLKTLGISGGATISGWGQSASISGNYLNQAKFSQNSLTYVAFLDVERQIPTPGGFRFNTEIYKKEKFAKVFGDRWIQGFKTGGRMIARITFTSKDGTETTDLKAHAEASLSFWGVKADLSVDAKKQLEEVNKHINVEASLFYQGELGIFMDKDEGAPKDISAGSVEAVLGQVKSWADKFEKHACNQDYAYGPLLNEYTVLPAFNQLDDSPQIPDYTIAHIWALEILRLMVKIEEQKKVLSSGAVLDDAQKIEMTAAAIDMMEKCKKWVYS